MAHEAANPVFDAGATRRALLARGAGLAAGLAAGLPLAAGCGALAREPSASSASGSGTSDAPADTDQFPELADQRPLVAPVSEAERNQRRARAAELMRAASIDALLCEGGATMTYLSGMRWGHSERLFALLLCADGSHLWVCPAFEESRARLRVEGLCGGPLLAWAEHEYPFKPLAAALRERRVERLAIEPALRFSFADRLGAEFGRERLVSGHALVAALRSKKSAHELELLRRANEATQQAIVAVAQRLRPGLNGADIHALIDAAHRKLGMSDPWGLCLIGPAAALPHGEQHDIRLARGDVLLMDVGAGLHGYQSDNTRSWVFDGPPTIEIERVWNVVRDAQQQSFDMLGPGVRCSDVDRRARAIVDARGFGPGYRTFTHRLGHGIGLEGHEDPYFDGGSEVVLEAGMTLSNEPGIYLPGQFGIRLEDIVALTAHGADHFGAWQTSVGSPA